MVMLLSKVYNSFITTAAEILTGRVKSVNAKHYLLNEIDRMTEQYLKAWKKFNLF